MTGDVGVQQADHRWLRGPHSWRSITRIVLVAMWVIWAALSWWTAPRQDGLAQVRADLAAGRVEAYQWGDHWDDEAGPWDGPRTLQKTGGDATILVWRTSDLQVHYANFDPSQLTGQPPGGLRVDGDNTDLGRELAAGAPQARTTGFAPIATPMQLLVLVSSLVVLLILVSHPNPVMGTRWYWFWTMVITPYGLGLLYWLARERPWAAGTPPPPRLNGRDPRRGWFRGIIDGIVVAIVLTLLLALLKWLLGDTLFPV